MSEKKKKKEKETVIVSYVSKEPEEFTYSSIEEGQKAWPIEKWEREGMPKVFCKVETTWDGYEVQVDVSYGSIRLLYKGEIIGSGRNIISGVTGHEIVVLDKEYYGVSKYIWR